MRCSICNRPLFKPALSVGHMHLGRVCAAKVGLLEPRKPRQAVHDQPARITDPYTRPLFEAHA